MPKNPDIKKVLVIGSGPIVIGQAAELLMRAIQYANPGQAYRDIRLVTHEEYRARRDNWKSDCTCDSEKIRHSGKPIYINKPFLY